ncbi:peptide/nickel transport system ATP-binding protein [Kineothrix alysoides]|uniref:Peptide/nickel transport system ATP-binding protein n=1 Tax=Kineothrix alysoides TaxID=1469948 RepID=A0A4R1R0V2_9FIRM|nr:ATP-binding cassette domain-containing protein [Kineothrix alysoides]TCL58935.1 peptide/nickel transport system ATP-binding protein [Kineothrix alysoides]
MVLKGEELSFRYQSGGRQILNHVSLSIESGEIVGLCAPSGFGKTTLCKILGGYAEPDSGTASLEGKSIRSYRGYCPVQMIWQHPELVINPRLKMSQVLAEAGDIDEHVITNLGIETEWMSRYPIELSGGELQRFCIARALGEGTRFILADEITTMLDLITQAQIWNFLKTESMERNIGMLVVSHSGELLDKLCSRRIDMQAFS